MYSDEDLDAAVADAVLNAADVQSFRAFIERRRAQPAVDEEHFRLLTGFNDIFVSIALVMILGAVSYLGAQASYAVSGWATAGAAWALAEFFTRKRRMALPSILLLCAWALGSFFGTLAALGGQVESLQEGEWSFLAASLLAVAVAVLHWRRFRVPITIAAGVAGLALTIASLVAMLAPSWSAKLGSGLMLLMGLAVFLLALRWDASDPHRRSCNSDVAFWLHLLAAPLIVHPLFSALDLLDGEASLTQALAGVGIYLLLGIIALLVDRRALLVSALVYVIASVSLLLKQTSSLGSGLAVTSLLVGLGLAVLSAFWHRSRGVALAALPQEIRNRLPAHGG